METFLQPYIPLSPSSIRLLLCLLVETRSKKSLNYPSGNMLSQISSSIHWRQTFEHSLVRRSTTIGRGLGGIKNLSWESPTCQGGLWGMCIMLRKAIALEREQGTQSSVAAEQFSFSSKLRIPKESKEIFPLFPSHLIFQMMMYVFSPCFAKMPIFSCVVDF